MNRSTYRSFLVIASFFYFQLYGQAQSIQVPAELAKANADIISPEPSHAIFYNPASLHIPVTSFLLGASYNDLGRRIEMLSKEITALKNDKEKQVEQIEKLIGKPVHLSSFIGAAHIPSPHSGIGAYVQSSADSIVRGRVLPILDMSIQLKSGFIVPFARPMLNKQLVVGFALKPTYKFEHKVHQDAFEIFEDRTIIKPTESGVEGLGLGLDLGVLAVKRFRDHGLKLGANIQSIGGTHYRKFRYFAKDGSGSPSADKPFLALGGGYYYNIYVPYGVDLLAHYSYLWDDEENYSGSESHQYSLSLALFNRNLEFSWGSHKNLQCYGVKATLSFLSIFYGYYQGSQRGPSSQTRDDRHFIQLSSSW